MAEILKADLCVIGAGALGRTLALAGRARGLSVILVQRPGDAPGRTRNGELARAAILASAARAHAMASAPAMGLAKADPKPSLRLVGERAAALVAAAAPAAAPEHLAAQGIVLLDQPAVILDGRRLQVGDAVIRAGQFVIATGSRPLLPELPGLNQVPFFTPDTIADNLRKLSHLLVIGGGAAALELAQAYTRLGATVTLVPQGPLLPGFDPEPVSVLLASLRAEGLTVLEGASVTAIQPRSQGIGIALTHADGAAATLDVSHILLAAGRVPDLDPALIAASALRRDSRQPGGVLLQPDGRTSNRRITVIGGAAGAFDASHALQQCAHVLARATGQAMRPLDPARLPRLVATTPALAQIGEAGALVPRRAGELILRANASETAAARADGDLAGSATLLVGAGGRVRGAAILGPGAGDLLAMLALAFERDMDAAALADLLVPAGSRATLLVDLGRQYRALHPPSTWARRLAALRHWLP